MTTEEILKKLTRREIIAEYLKQHGARQILPSRSRKYLQFEWAATSSCGTNEPAGITYWVGKAGALRKGGTIAESISLTDRINIKKLAAKIQI